MKEKSLEIKEWFENNRAKSLEIKERFENNREEILREEGGF